MITFSKLGKHGNLGNQLFQIASLMGLGKIFGHEVVIPEWKYRPFFDGLPLELNISGELVEEKHFHYDLDQFQKLNNDGNYDVLGWLQSHLYFKSKLFTLKDIVKNESPTIGISIRRGDYVDNPNYYQLEINYYLNSLLKIGLDKPIKIFSDDLEYCKKHFECLPNVSFINKTPIEQLQEMAGCEWLIIANSTFSWWGAYLGNGKVTRPNALFAGDLLKNDDKDFYPQDWQIQDVNEKIDLSDVTFVIPVKYDHPHREENLLLCIEYLQHHFNTNIIIGEIGNHFKYFEENVRRIEFDLPYFHRTKMLNDLSMAANTPYVINYDCDVFVSPVQIVKAIYDLRNGDDFVYPYDGRFARVPRNELNTIHKYMDVGMLKGNYTGNSHKDFKSVGGAIAYNVKSFIKAGGENENFISYAPEDIERKYRFETLGFKVERVSGSLFHLDHYVSLDSSPKHQHFDNNKKELEKIKGLSKEDLTNYVKSWKELTPLQLKTNTNQLIPLKNQTFRNMYKPNPQFIGCKIVGNLRVIKLTNNCTQEELEFISNIPEYSHLVIADLVVKKNDTANQNQTISTGLILNEPQKEEQPLKPKRGRPAKV
jgi:hypothetical protein